MNNNRKSKLAGLIVLAAAPWTANIAGSLGWYSAGNFAGPLHAFELLADPMTTWGLTAWWAAFVSTLALVAQVRGRIHDDGGIALSSRG